MTPLSSKKRSMTQLNKDVICTSSWLYPIPWKCRLLNSTETKKTNSILFVKNSQATQRIPGTDI